MFAKRSWDYVHRYHGFIWKDFERIFAKQSISKFSQINHGFMFTHKKIVLQRDHGFMLT